MTAKRVAKMIRQQTRRELNLTASAGVAPSRFLAKIVSNRKKPNGLFVIQPHEVQSFLVAPASVALSLSERVEIGPAQLFRLVGVGAENFQVEAEADAPLFQGIAEVDDRLFSASN